jgi:hypothetical protein
MAGATLGFIAVGVLLLAVFVVIQRRVAAPPLPRHAEGVDAALPVPSTFDSFRSRDRIRATARLRTVTPAAHLTAAGRPPPFGTSTRPGWDRGAACQAAGTAVREGAVDLVVEVRG